MKDSRRLARMLKALAVPARVRIVQLLKERALCVGAMTARLEVTQGAVSQHLRILRDAGLVVDERRGYYVHYRLNERTLAGWRKAMGELLDPACTDRKGAKPCAAAMRKQKPAGSRKT